MKHKNEFCVLILSHGRANSVFTVNMLARLGYTGDWFLLIDNEDSQIDQYRAMFGEDKVLVFDKEEIMKHHNTDARDNFEFRKSILYARQACFPIMKKMGYKYFCEYEDDYDSVRWRMSPEIEYSSKMLSSNPKHRTLDKVLDVMIDYLAETPRLQALCMAQSGDYIGGGSSRMIQEQSRRKAMNSWICDVDRYFDFSGTMNDDVNAYTTLAQSGMLFLTTGYIAINQKQTQGTKNGNTDMYKTFGTYVKSFYSVIGCPSGVKVSTLSNLGDRVKTKEFRVHHTVEWKYTAPKILSESVRKKSHEDSDNR